MDLPVIERALCNEIWGGNCKEVLLYPEFYCPNGHSQKPSKNSNPPRVVVGWDGESAEVDLEALVRTVLSPFMSEGLITKLLENVVVDQPLAQQLSQAPNLPLAKFSDCLKHRQIPVRSLELLVDEMLRLFETAPKSSWLSGYSRNEVPGTLWDSIHEAEQEMVVGPVPNSAHNSNLERLTTLTGDPVFHHSLIAEICNRSLPRHVAEQAFEQFRVSQDVDVWDLREAKELIMETYGD